MTEQMFEPPADPDTPLHRFAAQLREAKSKRKKVTVLLVDGMDIGTSVVGTVRWVSTTSWTCSIKDKRFADPVHIPLDRVKLVAKG